MDRTHLLESKSTHCMARKSFLVLHTDHSLQRRTRWLCPSSVPLSCRHPGGCSFHSLFASVKMRDLQSRGVLQCSKVRWSTRAKNVEIHARQTEQPRCVVTEDGGGLESCGVHIATLDIFLQQTCIHIHFTIQNSVNSNILCMG